MLSQKNEIWLFTKKKKETKVQKINEALSNNDLYQTNMVEAAKNGPCRFWRYDCDGGLGTPHKGMCVGDYSALTSPYEELGVCKCIKFFGYWGPSCEKLSRISYAFATMMVVVAMAALFTASSNVHHMTKTYNSRGKPHILLLRSPGGRTLLFNTFLSSAMFMLGVGLGAQIVLLDKTGTYVRILRYPTETAIACFFAATTLSVSMLWLEMAQKVKWGRPSVKSLELRRPCTLVLIVLVVLSGIIVSALACTTYGPNSIVSCHSGRAI